MLNFLRVYIKDELGLNEWFIFQLFQTYQTMAKKINMMKKESKQTKSCHKSPLINVTRLQIVNSLVMSNQQLILSKVGMSKIL